MIHPEHISQENIIARSKETLPPIAAGHIRLVHITKPEYAEEILKNGLDYSKYGMIDSMTRGWGKAEEVEYGMDDPRFRSPEQVAVVIDLPNETHRLHRDITKSPGIIPPEFIVGIISANEK